MRRPKPSPRVFAHRAAKKLKQSPVTPVASSDHKTRGIDVILSRLASTAQVCALFLAVFGYFYTVLPVFQNQKLQEDNAKLQMENESQEKKLGASISKQAAIIAKTEELQGQLEKERNAVIQSGKKVANAERQAIVAVRTAQQNAEQLRIELSNLESARWKIVYENFFMATSIEYIRQHGQFLDELYKTTDDNDTFLLDTLRKWPDPLQLVQSGLKYTENKNIKTGIPGSYASRLHTILDEQSSLIICNPPNFSELQKQYLEEKNLLEAKSKREATDEIERQRTAAEKNGQRLQVTEKDIAAVTRSYRLGNLFSLNKRYRDMVIAAEKPCDDAIQKFFLVVKKEVGIPDE